METFCLVKLLDTDVGLDFGSLFLFFFYIHRPTIVTEIKLNHRGKEARTMH